jgi:hypothetical protein
MDGYAIAALVKSMLWDTLAGLRNFLCSADEFRPMTALGQKQLGYYRAAEAKGSPRV